MRKPRLQAEQRRSLCCQRKWSDGSSRLHFTGRDALRLWRCCCVLQSLVPGRRRAWVTFASYFRGLLGFVVGECVNGGEKHAGSSTSAWETAPLPLKSAESVMNNNKARTWNPLLCWFLLLTNKLDFQLIPSSNQWDPGFSMWWETHKHNTHSHTRQAGVMSPPFPQHHS